MFSNYTCLAIILGVPSFLENIFSLFLRFHFVLFEHFNKCSIKIGHVLGTDGHASRRPSFSIILFSSTQSQMTKSLMDDSNSNVFSHIREYPCSGGQKSQVQVSFCKLHGRLLSVPLLASEMCFVIYRCMTLVFAPFFASPPLCNPTPPAP